MMLRWAIATAGALALALLTLNVPMPWASASHSPSDPDEASGGAGAVCDAKAKPANLNFTLKDAANKDLTISAYKGKVIVLDFWATWCDPCKLEIPGFIDLQNKYGARGLQFVGIQVEDSPELLKPFADEYKINYPVLKGTDRDDVVDAFGPIFGIPTTVVISRDGRICRKHPGYTKKDVFEREIKALL